MSDDDDDDAPKKRRGPPWDEFECPECTAYNPYGDGFEVGDELACQYCGMMWRVRRTDEGFRLVEA
jgi:hypothetical protein